MINIVGASAGEAWLRYLDSVLERCSELPDDKGSIFEGPPAFVEIEAIEDTDPIIGRFGDAALIELYTKKMFSTEIVLEFGSTYGGRLFSWNGIDQVQNAIAALKRHWWTKSAAIGLISPTEDMPRVPCLIGLVPMVRDNKLILNATFRSQNVFNSYANFFGLRALQRYIANELDIKAGPIRIAVFSPHIYPADVQRARAAVASIRNNAN